MLFRLITTYYLSKLKKNLIFFLFQKMEFKKKDSLLMEEKTARMRAEQGLQDFTEKMVDMEDRLKHVEQGSRENKNALAQLISHTKNVERAVTMNQQDLLQRKEAQAAK